MLPIRGLLRQRLVPELGPYLKLRRLTRAVGRQCCGMLLRRCGRRLLLPALVRVAFLDLLVDLVFLLNTVWRLVICSYLVISVVRVVLLLLLLAGGVRRASRAALRACGPQTRAPGRPGGCGCR